MAWQTILSDRPPGAAAWYRQDALSEPAQRWFRCVRCLCFGSYRCACSVRTSRGRPDVDRVKHDRDRLAYKCTRKYDRRGPTGSSRLECARSMLPVARVDRAVLKVAQAAGIGRVSPHQLRHTLATQAINRGMSLEAVAALLGHRSLSMTLVYARIATTAPSPTSTSRSARRWRRCTTSGSTCQ